VTTIGKDLLMMLTSIPQCPLMLTLSCIALVWVVGGDDNDNDNDNDMLKDDSDDKLINLDLD
jgi:hypothetical protein